VDTLAVVFERPEVMSMRRLPLVQAGDTDVVVRIDWTGISTGTERLLWTGKMPPFPGLEYPLVPGYEAVGTIVQAGPASGRAEGELVFVAGSRSFEGVRGLFGATARTLVVPGMRAVPLAAHVGQKGTLLALAATAYHAIKDGNGPLPDLVVGHGALGRLIARIVKALDPAHAVTVWETNPTRRTGALGYDVIDPETDARRDYGVICDVSGVASLVDGLLARLKPKGELCLAGFYDTVSFVFPAAFMKEARIRIAAEFSPADLLAVATMASDGRLPLDGLITHTAPATEAPAAYATAFGDPACVKMVLDWRHTA
jgi:3-hydroxyethyl bacteriochlorophyllide a dehydrogenase